MPCRSDYLEPSSREIESRRVCKLLVYVCSQMKLTIPEDVKESSRNAYGDVSQLDYHTRLLCSLLNSLDESERERIIYNARDPRARRLANWWEKHLESDRKREEEQEKSKRDDKLRKAAIAKLTKEELKALGIKP